MNSERGSLERNHYWRYYQYQEKMFGNNVQMKLQAMVPQLQLQLQLPAGGQLYDGLFSLLASQIDRDVLLHLDQIG